MTLFSTRGNFKQTYATAIAKAQKKLVRLMDGKLSAEEVFTGTRKDFTLTLDSEMPIELGETNLDAYTIALLGINVDFLPDYNQSVIANHQALFAAMHLLKIGSIAPCIAKNSKAFNSITWFPAEIDIQAKRIVEQLEEIVPADIICTAGRKNKLYPQHLRRAYRQDDSAKTPSRRHDRSHRRKLDRETQQQGTARTF